jgi:sec-independent protein translocase protein TatA
MPTLAFMENVGMGELLVILFIVLLLFGSTKLPQLARALGSSVKEFKKGAREDDEEEKKADAAKPEAGKEKPKLSDAEKN